MVQNKAKACRCKHRIKLNCHFYGLEPVQKATMIFIVNNFNLKCYCVYCVVQHVQDTPFRECQVVLSTCAEMYAYYKIKLLYGFTGYAKG